MLNLINKYNLTQDDIDSYQQGQSLTSLAKSRKVSPKQMKKLLIGKGLEIRRTGYKHGSKYQRSTVKISHKDIQDYQCGKSAYSIAQEKNTTASTILRKSRN